MAILDALRKSSTVHWRASVEALLAAVPSPTPRFNITIGSVRSYDEMFSGSPSGFVVENELIEQALKNGRVLISGRGGGGKTVMLGRVARQALKMGGLPVFLSLKSWTQANSETWRSFESRLVRVDYLIRTLANSNFGTSELDSLSPNVKRVLIVDGLNEVDGRIAQEMIFALDEYASTAISTSVIVSDRLARREFVRSGQWSLYLVMPLSISEVKKRIPKGAILTDDEINLLRSPYFLGTYLSSGKIAHSRSEEIQKWFETHSGLTAADIDRASKAAYTVYGSSSRTFSLRAFEGIAGRETTEKLTNSGSGALLISGDSAIFDHHLKHDFLASRYLAARQNLWTSESFNRVTFSGSSFDAIMLCIEQIPKGPADDFVRAVYDWNLYAVGYALGESGRHNVSPEMVIVVLSMFAEKRWDIVKPTRQRVYDSLLVLKDVGANRFLEAESLEKVFDLIREHQDSGNSVEFREWKDLFTRPVGSEIDDNLLKLLYDHNSIKGWTAANVLKRSALSLPQLALLRSALESPDSVVRWRAAHALGAFPSQANADVLLHFVGDSNEHVRYGAVRSVIELASRATDDVRHYVFDSLVSRRVELVKFSSVIQEIRRSLLILQVRDPRGWLNLSLKLMIAVQPVDSESERDKWGRAVQEMIAMFTEVER